MHEIGILLRDRLPARARSSSRSCSRPSLLGLLGGLVGCLPSRCRCNGVETGTTNFKTFTEVAFAFRVTPQVLLTAALFSLVLGLVGGAWPAWRAARMTPTEALRRQ